MKDSGNNTNQKAGWMIGIALILFLILLGGSLIGMKLIRDNIGKYGGYVERNDNEINYDTLDDGTKVSINPSITHATIDKSGIVFDNFRISESEDINVSGESVGIWSDIDFEVENTTEDNIENKIYIVELYDENDSLITEFSVNIDELEAGKTKDIRQTITTEVVNAARIEISSMSLGFEE